MSATPLTPPTVPAAQRADVREEIRIVICAGMCDPIELGEEVARFPPGTGLDVVRLEMIRIADESRGVDVSVDVFCHKLIWERFVSVCYEPGWKIDPATGIILERDEPVADMTAADLARLERGRFEHERARRVTAQKRRENRGHGKVEKTATSH